MSNVRKVPMRKCVGCGEMKSKKEMMRVLKTTDEEFVLDATGKKNGRGAYICKSENCLEKVIKTKKLEKVFEKNISPEIYESIRGVIIDK